MRTGLSLWQTKSGMEEKKMNESSSVASIQKYFLAKPRQPRKLASSTNNKVFDAVEIANKVLRLCFPYRVVKTTRVYWNNFGTNLLITSSDPEIGPEWVKAKTVDVYFWLLDQRFEQQERYDPDQEKESFVVEVAYPAKKPKYEKGRWDIARVRWAHLGLDEDSPIEALVGETYTNFWF